MPYEVRKDASCPSSKPWAVVKKDGGKVLGCHPTKEQAVAQEQAIGANSHAVKSVTLATDSPTASGGVGGVGNTNLPVTTASPAFTEGAQTASWEGILVVEGVTTGDGREFAGGSLSWPDAFATQLPLSWQKSAIGGHDGSVVVGRIDQIWRDTADPAIIRASGEFDLGSPEGQEAHRQVKDGFLKGVSVDVDSVNEADIEYVYKPSVETSEDDSDEDEAGGLGDLLALFSAPEKMVYHAGRVRGATLVALPAFVEAQIALVDHQPSLVASGGHVCRGINKLAPHMRRDGEFDLALGARQIGVVLSSPEPKLTLMLRRTIHAHLADHMRGLGLTPQPFSLDALTDDVRETLTASGGVVMETVARPPAEWFTDPQLNGRAGLHVDEPDASGLRRVYGYAAHFGVGHIGFPDSFRTAPREDRHDYFLQGEVLTADGSFVSVGSITLGTGHASVDPGLSAAAVMAHYDNTGTAVADVAVGNDDHGIWVAGYVRAGVSPARVVELRAAKLSGDWRRIGGKLRMVALLAVNVPGFPQVPTVSRVKSGMQFALVAAGIDPTTLITPLRSQSERDAIRRMKMKLATQIGRDPASRKAELRAKIHSTGV